jgi:glycosyltransferase involved in cell wall biosynthesis
MILSGAFPDQQHGPGSIELDEIDGMLVYRVGMPSMGADENFCQPSIANYLKSLMGLHKPDVVHFHNVLGLGANLISVAKDAGAKVIVTLHDHWGFCFKNTILRNTHMVCTNFEECAACQPTIGIGHDFRIPMRLRRDYVSWCLGQADRLISPTEYLASAYRQSELFGDKEIEILSNGIDLTAFSKSSTLDHYGRLHFSCFSYLGTHKGIDVLLDAAQLLTNDDETRGRWHLTLAGSGYLEERVRSEIGSGRFGSAVICTGQLPHDQALELMTQTDVAILASIWPENEPVSMLEAIASGTAQLASGIGGNLKLVEDEQSGLIFRPGDALDLAEKMRRYILEPGLAEAHGNRNWERRTNFDERRTLDRLETIYDDDLNEKRDAYTTLVLCVGNSLPREIAPLFHYFRRFERPRSRVLFVWHEWADPMLWAEANLLWLWDESNNLPSIMRALRQGLPLLVPSGTLADRLPSAGIVVSYQTYLEALAAILLISKNQSRDLPKGLDPALARIVASAASPESFHLNTQRIR